MNPRQKVSRKGTRKRARAPRTHAYPFSAIVGQEEMKLALLLNAVDPKIGGVLIMGHRGTGKSTAVRALPDLLPQIERVRGCPYGCDPKDEAGLCDECHARLDAGEKLSSERVPVPVVNLPLGATEDRVCGTIDIERALREGLKAFEPGLLARANRGFLYIDEVNLLEDHLIDLLLDVAATGRSLVEREGVSVEHPARFVLVGSGNPEEGDLRPQLLDRFGLNVEVKTASDSDERVQIVERRDNFERDREGFLASVRGEQEGLRRKVARARRKLDSIKLSRELLRGVAELCQQLKVEGHRGELTITRSARALAALEGRREVTAEHVRRVAVMSLSHRLRRDPLEQADGGSRVRQRLDEHFPQEGGAQEPLRAEEQSSGAESPSTPAGNGKKPGGFGGNTGKGGGTHEQPPAALDAKLPVDVFSKTARDKRARSEESQTGRRSEGSGRRPPFNSRRGRYVSNTSHKTEGARIALDATLRATLCAVTRDRGRMAGELTDLAHDLRYKRFRRKAGALFIFAVDTSGSMASGRIAQAKGALVRLLQQSYIRRDRVALVAFRGEGAEQLLPPSGSVTRARRLLDGLSMGGATPLAAGLACALDVAARAGKQGAERVVLLLFTDGRANVPLESCVSQVRAVRRAVIEDELRRLGAAARTYCAATVVVDSQSRFTSGGEGERLAELLGVQYVRLETVGGGLS